MKGRIRQIRALLQRSKKKVALLSEEYARDFARTRSRSHDAIERAIQEMGKTILIDLGTLCNC